MCVRLLLLSLPTVVCGDNVTLFSDSLLEDEWPILSRIVAIPCWLMSGNWCDCRALAQRDGAPRCKSLPDGRMRGE